MKRTIANLLTWQPREAGQTIVEYALILAVLSVALIGSLTLFQSRLGDLFQTLIDALNL
jgi:Flp pilus assembly pilin Flp